MSFKKIGILGGGQLGRMMQEVAQQRNMPVWCLDKGHDYPAALYRDYYVVGDILNYDDVMQFGEDKDVITVEIEHVNLDALKALQNNGKEVHPNPNALGIIKNKNSQKKFYADNKIPIPLFTAFQSKDEAIRVFPEWENRLPCIYKSAEMGYDGKGVRTIRNLQDVHELDDIAGAFEEKIDIQVEVAVMIVRSTKGEHVIFPPVAMYFDENNHILSEVHFPCKISSGQLDTMNEIAINVTKSLDICGLCAFEFFISTNGDVVLNEIAPRPHNSMHISMNNSISSQFDQHLRAISGMPLGKPTMEKSGIMYNIIGRNEDYGDVNWDGWKQILSLESVFVHLYGKTIIKPARKMGHINIVGSDFKEIQQKLVIVKENFKNKQNGE